MTNEGRGRDELADASPPLPPKRLGRRLEDVVHKEFEERRWKTYGGGVLPTERVVTGAQKDWFEIELAYLQDKLDQALMTVGGGGAYFADKLKNEILEEKARRADAALDAMAAQLERVKAKSSEPVVVHVREEAVVKVETKSDEEGGCWNADQTRSRLAQTDDSLLYGALDELKSDAEVLSLWRKRMHVRKTRQKAASDMVRERRGGMTSAHTAAEVAKLRIRRAAF